MNAFTDLLAAKKLTLALAESMTCGLASHKLSTAPGTSKALRGSIICYSPEVKTTLLGIPQKMIRKYTAESQEVPSALAKNLGKLIKADLHAAVTGLSSANGTETISKPVGTVFFSVVYKREPMNKKNALGGRHLKYVKKGQKNFLP